MIFGLILCDSNWITCYFSSSFPDGPATFQVHFPFRVHNPINRIDLLRRDVIDVNGSFIFKVVARDHGIVSRSSNITVEMNIVDAGDDSPVFNR